MKSARVKRKLLQKWRRYFLVIFLVIFLLYRYLDFILDFSIYRERNLERAYFVNTTGCRMLATDPEELMDLMKSDVELMNCTKVQLFHTKINKGRKYLVVSIPATEILNIFGLKNITHVKCTYRSVERYNDLANLHKVKRSFHLRDKEKYLHINRGIDIVRIKCETSPENIIYHDVLFFPPALKPISEEENSRDSNRVSVMILGLDSISHMHFIRSMKKTAEFIKQLPHVEFWGYNRVGRNSYPNLVPLLSGMSEVELEASCCNETLRSYDDCDLIWKHFKAAGFSTVYAEDSSVGGTFNYGKAGFLHKPTDFYLRPIMLEIDRNTRYSIDEDENIHCTAARRYSQVYYEYIDGILPLMQHKSFFTFLWSTQGVHDYLVYAKMVDGEYLQLLRKFQTQGILNNTFVLFMADHGLRIRPDGATKRAVYSMLEESNPMLTVLYPQWLLDKYPLAMDNLKSNAHRLVTTYDMHATLKDLLSMRNLRDENVRDRMAAYEDLSSNFPRGMSLFLPMPEQRNCEMAGIPTHFCLCHSLKELPALDSRVQRAARFTVRSINALLRGKAECQSLALSSVLAGYLLENSLTDFQYEVKVRLQTQPGGGQFESTVRFSGYEMALNGDITRINRYGNQSYCIHDYHIEMYCYCL